MMSAVLLHPVRDDLGRHRRDPAQHRRRARARPAQGAHRSSCSRSPPARDPASRTGVSAADRARRGCSVQFDSGRISSRAVLTPRGSPGSCRPRRPSGRDRTTSTSTISQPSRRTARCVAVGALRGRRRVPLPALALDADAVLDVGEVQLGEQPAVRRAHRVLVHQRDAELGQFAVGQALEPAARQALGGPLGDELQHLGRAGAASNARADRLLHEPLRRAALPQRAVECFPGGVDAIERGDAEERYRHAHQGQAVHPDRSRAGRAHATRAGWPRCEPRDTPWPTVTCSAS